MQLAQRFFGSIGLGSVSRLLVLTDPMEEVDNETALWLLINHVSVNTLKEADVVFMSGNPLQRAMRWARIINNASSTSTHSAIFNRIRYRLGPQTSKPLKTQINIDE